MSFSSLYKTIGFFSILALPSVAFAEINSLEGLVNQLLGIGNSLVPLFFVLAFIGFALGIIRYIYSNDPKKIADARNYIFYSIISIVVMLGVYGLAFAIKNSFFPGAIAPLSCTSGSGPTYTGVLINLINQLVVLGNYLIPLIILIALITFIWGVIRYIVSADPKKIDEARKYMLFSVVGMALILGIWGVARIIKRAILPNTRILNCIQNGVPNGQDYYGPSNPNIPNPNNPNFPGLPDNA